MDDNQEEEKSLEKEVIKRTCTILYEYQHSSPCDNGSFYDQAEVGMKLLHVLDVEEARSCKEWWVQVKWWRMIKLIDGRRKNLMYGMKISLFKF